MTKRIEESSSRPTTATADTSAAEGGKSCTVEDPMEIASDTTSTLEVPTSKSISDPIKLVDSEFQAEEPAVDDNSDDDVAVDDESDEDQPEWEDLTEDGGVLKKVLQKGTGWERPSKLSDVEVHYVGTLTDSGKEFDSSRSRNKPFSFKLGVGNVIKGWDIGIKTMKRNEKAIFRIRSDYAYGSSGAGESIPPNATLDFEVELLSWIAENDLSKDGGVIARTVEAGTGWDTPKEGATVTVHYVGTYDGSEFINTRSTGEPHTFIIDEEQVIEGLEICLKSMKKGAIVEAKIEPKYAYGSSGNPTLNIPPNARLSYTIELVDFTKRKEPWAMSSPERIEQSTLAKNQGNEFLAQGRTSMAIKRYKYSLTLLESANYTESEKVESNKLTVASNANLAMVYLKLASSNAQQQSQAQLQKLYTDAVGCCNKVLDIEHNNIKALYRRAVANTHLKEYEIAKRDLVQLLSLDPENSDAKRAMATLESKIKIQDAKDRSLYAKMFS